MSKKNIIKIILDVMMAILFVTFFKKNLISMKFHMVSGLAFGVFIIIHMILNRKWIINISKRLFDNRVKIRTKISYIISTILFVSIIAILVSGIFILKSKTYDRVMFWKMLHFGASYLSIALVGMHIGLYWKWLVNMFNKIFNIKQNNKIIMNTLLAIVLSFGIYTMHNEKYINKTVNTIKYVVEHIKPQEMENPNKGYYQQDKVSFIKVSTTYGSIISVFAAATYYTDLGIKKYNRKKYEIKEVKL